jgi:hypothetical protein
LAVDTVTIQGQGKLRGKVHLRDPARYWTEWCRATHSVEGQQGRDDENRGDSAKLQTSAKPYTSTSYD